MESLRDGRVHDEQGIADLTDCIGAIIIQHGRAAVSVLRNLTLFQPLLKLPVGRIGPPERI